MPRAYPVELRERVVAAYEDGEGTYAELAERFKVGEASVSRWLSLQRNKKSLEPGKPPGAVGPTLIDESGLDFIRESLEAVPDTTILELVDAYEQEFGVAVSRSTMSRAVNQKLGFTRKKGVSGLRRRSARRL